MFILMRCRACGGTGRAERQPSWFCRECQGQGALFRDYLMLFAGMPVQ